MTMRVVRVDDGSPERASRRGHGVALAREAVLHPQEQSYIGSWCRDRSHRVRPRCPFPRERRSSVIT